MTRGTPLHPHRTFAFYSTVVALYWACVSVHVSESLYACLTCVLICSPWLCSVAMWCGPGLFVHMSVHRGWWRVTGTAPLVVAVFRSRFRGFPLWQFQGAAGLLPSSPRNTPLRTRQRAPRPACML